MLKIFTRDQFPQLLHKQRSAFTEIAGGDPHQTIAIVGAGDMGRRLLHKARAAGIQSIAVCDNDPSKQWTLMENTVLVVPTEKFSPEKNPDLLFLLGMYNTSKELARLKALGFKKVVTPATFCHHLQSSLLSISDAVDIDSQRADIEKCESLWSDNDSRFIYQKLIDWFSSDGTIPLVEHDDIAEMYSPPGLWSPIRGEVVVDCGAYDGDSVEMFSRTLAGRLKSITAYEPDPASYNKLQSKFGTKQDVYLRRAAVGNVRGNLSFTARNDFSSEIMPGGATRIECVQLDVDLLDAPTYIKMDVEGYEKQALHGAANVISNFRPILAICAYHKMSDLWQIPLLIHQLCPSYKLYLRKYAEDCWETCVYAVPTERALPSDLEISEEQLAVLSAASTSERLEG